MVASDGSGAEADAPGLAIWALTESAAYIADPLHDDWIWPHILRKTEWIERMLAARAPVVVPFSSPSPENLNHARQARAAWLAQPARDGVIVGRVGQEWPLVYVNAISHRGLLAAADFADRLGKRQHAVRWRTRAQALRESWERQMLPGAPEAAASPASISSVTPTPSGLDQLEQPVPTYRSPADDRGPAGQLTRSHQALRSGQPQAVWATLLHLWDHQASPGLYTWDAPRPTAEDVVDGWQFVRGWHNESVVSPDYETAALLLQLQQDMLAYVDEAAAEPTVVIGAGVIPSWLSQPMAVSGLALPGGSVDWQWNGQAMRVTLRGPSRPIRLGAAFPSGTELTIVQGSPTS